MSLPARTAPQLTAIAGLANKLQTFWTALDEILQYDGAYPGDKAVARAGLDAARTDLLNTVTNPLYYPAANKVPLLERIAIATELAVASLEDSDLQTVPDLNANSRDTARWAIAECHALAAAIVCGRL